MPQHNRPEQFAAQLQEGHYNELRVALYFMLKGAHVRIGFRAQRYDLDVRLPEGKQFSLEVKWDKAAARTGNVYFELRNTRQNAPSGLAATDAEYWCHVIGTGDEALFARSARLREVLAQGDFRLVNTRGEDSNSQGKLVPLKLLLAQADIYWIHLPTVEAFFGELFRRGAGSA